MADLHEGLERLAEDAPRSVPSSDLWRSGRRYGRRKTFARSLVALSCLTLVLAVGSTWIDLTPDQDQVAADPDAKTWLPDELFTPDPWLRSTTDRDGPPGQLIAVVRGEHRRFFSSEQGFYGVSAETGDYRFLNLPGLAQGATISVSPDGTKVAYWLANPQVSGFADGFAVYDTVSGEVDRHRIESRFGLVGEGFGWTEDSVWVQYSELAEPPTNDGWSADQAPTLIKNLIDGTTTIEDVGSVDLSSATSGSAGLVSNRRKGFTVVDPVDPNVRTRYQSTLQVHPAPLLTTDGTRVAGLRATNTSRDGEPLLVGTLPTGGNRVEMTELPGVKGFQVFGWQDNTHVLGLFANTPMVESLNVETGETTPAVNLSDATWGTSVLATDLLGSPIRDGVEPKAPPNTWSLISVAAVAAALGLWIWRRRVRV